MARSKLREKGQITMPAEVREALRVEEGDEVEFTVTPEGTVLLRGLKMIPADQAWFWSATWQAGELEASQDIAAGRMTTTDSPEMFLKELGG
jgi:AbrB family looped-hinge helix DNA binding protein